MKIKIYNTGNEFIEKNKEFLNKNKYMASFYFLDGPLINEVNNKEYCLKIYNRRKKLLIMKKEPYNALLYGDKQLIKPLFKYLLKEGYEIKDVLCSTAIGEKIIKVLKRKVTYCPAIEMDFMECKKKSDKVFSEVEHAKESDIDEIYEHLKKFLIDCGLNEQVAPKDRILKTIDDFRIIRVNNEIVSMAKLVKDLENSYKIADVYTKNEYRGKGYSRKVVTSLTDEIINMGKIATLNVDQKNPISYHLYTSIGYTKIFSQGEYRRK